MDKRTTYAIGKRLADLRDLHTWMGDEINALAAIFEESPVRVERSAPQPTQVMPLGDGPHRRRSPGSGKGKTARITTTKVSAAVLASIHRTIAEECSQALKARPDVALKTSQLVALSPTAQKRYTNDARRTAAIHGILAQMGPQFYVKNVSHNTHARWMYVTPIAVR